MPTNTPGSGDVEITLAGDTHTLKPSLQAATAMSRAGGDGILGMVRRVGQYDLDTIVDVIAAGLGGRSKDLPELVWKSGLQELAGPCIRFLHILANGGRPPEEGGEGEADPQKGASS